MNIQTIKYIAMIAGEAAARVNRRETLKSAKAHLADAMAEETTPYVNHEGVDFEAVNSRPNLLNAVNINTKGGFLRQLGTMIEKMEEAREEAVFNFRVAQAIKSGRVNHGVELHAADVIEWANGEVHFNFTQCANELVLEAATPADHVNGATVEVGQIIENEQGRPFIVTQVMRMAGYTDASGHVEGTAFPVTHGYRSVRFDTCHANRLEYGVKSTRLVRGVTPPEPEHDPRCDDEGNDPREWCGNDIKAAHAEALAIESRRRVAEFYGNNDHAARRAIVEAAHAEALTIEAPTPAPHAKPENLNIIGYACNGYQRAATPFDLVPSPVDVVAYRLPDNNVKLVVERDGERVKTTIVRILSQSQFETFARVCRRLKAGSIRYALQVMGYVL